MRALLYDCASGISGDMNLGALVDLGVPQEYLLHELARLQLGEEFTLTFARAEKQGITGRRATVTLAGRGKKENRGAGTPGEHPHHHQGEVAHTHQGGEHAHRHYRDIKEIIKASPFKSSIKTTTQRIFDVIAEAEAHVHGIAADAVVFHEVGAVDSIVDIFGAAICLDYLAVDRVFSGPVELGSGFVQCAHGRLAVPAPATLEILTGVPCLTGGVEGEATTPTGAAILKATAHKFSRGFAITPERVGYGIGHRDFTIPNVLRVVMGEVREPVALTPYWVEHTSVEIAANIDDMPPECYEPLIERLFSAGASDVFLTPITMKKSRLAHMISVLAQEHLADSLTQILFEESTTIGLRLHAVGKRMLSRTSVTVPTSFGDVQVKVVQGSGGTRRWKVEYEDVKRLTSKSSLSYLSMHRRINDEVAEHFAAVHPQDKKE